MIKTRADTRELTERLDELLKEVGADALLVVADAAQDVDLAPFVGEAHLRRSFLLAPRGREPQLGVVSPMEREEAVATGLELVTPEEMDVARLRHQLPRGAAQLAAILNNFFDKVGVETGTIALAGHAGSGEVYEALRQLEGADFRFVDGGEVMRRLRKRKRVAEIVAAQESAAGAVAAFHRVAKILAGSEVEEDGRLRFASEPLTVGLLRREIASALASHGLAQPDGNIVAPGGEGAVPHNAGRNERQLRQGESLIVDLYPKGATLYADCTRTFCVGTPPEALATAHGAVLNALRQAHLHARPGVMGHEVHSSVCDLLEARGYATLRTDASARVGYVHLLGHGVGLELHEYPSFTENTGAAGRLEVGDLITLEPGLYQPSENGQEGWGVRLEDLVALGADGPQNLTPLPYELDPRDWGGGEG